LGPLHFGAETIGMANVLSQNPDLFGSER